MSTTRVVTDAQSHPVVITAKPALAVVELMIGSQHAPLAPRQARILAYAILTAAEEAEAGFQES
jgi:hypothetical protein